MSISILNSMLNYAPNKNNSHTSQNKFILKEIKIEKVKWNERDYNKLRINYLIKSNLKNTWKFLTY